MPEWLNDLGMLLTVGASLIAIGVSAGSLPRLSKTIDEHRESDRAEKDKLWSRIEEIERSFARYRERIAERLGGPLFAYKWAQNTSHGNATSILAGSYMTVTRYE